MTCDLLLEKVLCMTFTNAVGITFTGLDVPFFEAPGTVFVHPTTTFPDCQEETQYRIEEMYACSSLSSADGA
jgi:hypothetical protein